MNIFKLHEPIALMCMDVPAFPKGIPETFDKLSKLLPSAVNRVFYGISYMNGSGKIIYKAAVSLQSPGEAVKYNCELFTVTEGEYLAETILDWMENIPEIGKTFQAMIKDEQVDNNSVCIEWYKTKKELMCMVKLKNQE